MIPQLLYITCAGTGPQYFTWQQDDRGLVPFIFREKLANHSIEDTFNRNLDCLHQGYWSDHYLFQAWRLVPRFVTAAPRPRPIPWPANRPYKWLSLETMATRTIHPAAEPVLHDFMADRDPKRSHPLTRRLVPQGYEYHPMPPQSLL